MTLRKPVFRYIGDTMYPVPEFPLAVVTSMHDHPEPVHTHDFAELVIVREGAARHVSGNVDESAPIEGGDALLIGHGESHAYTDIDGLVLDNLLFRHDVFAGPTGSATLDSFAVIEPLFRLPLVNRTVHLSEAEHRRAIECMDDIRQELSQRRPGFRGMASSRFLEIVVIVGRSARRRMQAESPAERPAVTNDSAVLAAEEYMRLHFSEPLTLEQIASVASLSTHHFCAVFKRETGQTPWQFLLQLRIAHARFLLSSNRGMPVTQVASACGFADAAYFARVFRAGVGASPTEYRTSLARTL